MKLSTLSLFLSSLASSTLFNHAYAFHHPYRSVSANRGGWRVSSSSSSRLHVSTLQQEKFLTNATSFGGDGTAGVCLLKDPKVPNSVTFDDLNPPTSPDEIVPLEGSFDWGKDDLLDSPFWGLELSASDLAEIDAALKVCKTEGSGLDLQDGWQPLGVTQENFPLDALAIKVKDMAHELEHGAGAVMIKNMPVKDYSIEDVGIIYAGINSYIGNWIPQSSAGLRSKSRGFGLPLGRVEAEMSGNTPKNGYQANNYFRLHTDRCDVITLMCIRPAAVGGASRVCSAVRVHNTMLNEYPDLCARLYQPFYRIWEGVNGYFDLPVWSVYKGKFTSQVSPSYIENAQVLPEVPRLDEEGIEAVDIIEEIGLRESVDFMMQPGMVYWLNNHGKSELLRCGRILRRIDISQPFFFTFQLFTTDVIRGNLKGNRLKPNRVVMVDVSCCVCGSPLSKLVNSPTRTATNSCGGRPKLTSPVEVLNLPSNPG
jgi:Taurine catabolism dioxygenase TauD, TfdA family